MSSTLEHGIFSKVCNRLAVAVVTETNRSTHSVIGKGQLTTEEFPFDLDTTSLGLTILKRDKDIANSVMNEMLEYVDPDGIIQVCNMSCGHLFQKHSLTAARPFPDIL